MQPTRQPPPGNGRTGLHATPPLAEGHVARTGPSTRPSNRLTRAEAAVLRLLAMGHSSAEAAGELGLTADAVRDHLCTARGTLGARTKLEAILAALRSGQLRLEDAAE